MGERVYQGLTVGYCLALTQFLMVFGLGLWYLRKADNEFDPLAEKAIAAYADDAMHPGERHARGRARRVDGGRAMTFFAEINVEAVVIFAIVLSITLGVTYWASQADVRRVDVLRGGPPDHRHAERPRDLGRLPLGRLVPRHRGPDLPLRLRRVPVLDRVPRRVPDGDVPARGADAQRGQVHDRRRAARSGCASGRRAPPRRWARSPSRRST